MHIKRVVFFFRQCLKGHGSLDVLYSILYLFCSIQYLLARTVAPTYPIIEDQAMCAPVWAEITG